MIVFRKGSSTRISYTHSKLLNHPKNYGEPKITSDITVASKDTDAIRILITSSDIHIDLNDISVVGPITCFGEGATLNCSEGGSGVGVELNGPGSSVGNGFIRGMGSSGVALGAKNQAYEFTVRWSGAFGITASEGVKIRDSIVFENVLDGIHTGDNSMLSNNVVRANGGAGRVLSVHSPGCGSPSAPTTR